MDFLRALNPRRVVLIVATLLLAFASGHLMQSGLLTEIVSVDDGSDAAPSLPGARRDPALPAPPAATLAPMDLPPPQIQRSESLNDSAATPGVAPDSRFSPYGLSCDVMLDVEAVPGAMLQIEIDAPCHPDREVMIDHEGVVIADRTNAFGHLSLKFPALEYRADLDVEVAGAGRQEIAVVVPEVMDYHRVVLAWTGDSPFRIRANEPRRTVWGEEPGTVDDGIAARGGFLTRLGTDPTAEIYSFPIRARAQGRIVKLRVEAEVTAANCDRVLTAAAHQAGAIGGTMVRPLSVKMPDCARIGDVIAIDGAFRDLRIALR